MIVQTFVLQNVCFKIKFDLKCERDNAKFKIWILGILDKSLIIDHHWLLTNERYSGRKTVTVKATLQFTETLRPSCEKQLFKEVKRFAKYRCV